MDSLKNKLEAVLFVAGKPLTIKKMAQSVGAPESEVVMALEALKNKYGADTGVVLLNTDSEWQLTASAEQSALTEHFIKAEVSGELTRAQLEALTVIAYRGPITRPELEQIRGVNCSLILRNLLLRGLVQETGEGDALLPKYEVTMEYLRHLGLSSLQELPDYATLHAHEYVTAALEQTTKE